MKPSNYVQINKRVLVAFLMAVVIIGYSIYANKKDFSINTLIQKNLPNTQEKSDQSKLVNLEELVKKDSDGDGVPDWEESLWGTSPNNPDTLGHGSGDRAEIDKIKTSLRDNNSVGVGVGGNSQTSLFTRQLYSSVVALKQSGNFSNTTIDSLSTGITDNIREQSKEKIYYVMSDLKVVGVATSTILSYKDDILRIAAKYARMGLGDEVIVLAKSVDAKNQATLKGLDQYIIQYRKILGENLEIAVPKNLAQNHLNLVNGYRNIVESLSLAEEIFSDPMAGLMEMTRYRNATNSVIISLSEIERYLIDRGIILNK